MAKQIRFRARIRYWNEDAQGGLAVADIPSGGITALGGRRQARVTGTLNGRRFTGTTMLVRGGGLCVSVTNAARSAAGAGIGDTATFVIDPPKGVSRTSTKARRERRSE